MGNYYITCARTTEATSDRHCGLPKEILIRNSAKLLEVGKDLIELAIEKEIKLQSLVIDL